MKMNVKRKTIFFVAIGLMGISSFISSCYYDSQEELFGVTPCDTTSVSYTEHILPFLQDQCFVCHSATAAPLVGGDNNMEGFENLMGYVVAGDPENSLFYASVAWLPGAVPMPNPPGSSQISDCELALIRSWILQGASNN